MKTLTNVLLSTVLVSSLFAHSNVYLTNNSQVPDLKIPKNDLIFKELITILFQICVHNI